MHALVFENGVLHLDKTFPVPDRPAGEALIKLVCAGLCTTDLAITKGYMSFAGVPGHEFVGTVADTDDELFIGKRVVGGINVSCGKCGACRAGNETHCPERTVLGIQGRNGTFAEYFLLPETNLIPVPDNVPDEAAVFAEPLAAAMRILEQIELPSDKRTAVIGDGRLGLLISLVLINAGCMVELFGHHPKRIVPLAGCSISHNTGAPEEDSFGFVVECSGSPDGLEAAYSAVRPLGTLVMKSTYVEPGAPNPWQVVVKELNVIGSRCGGMKAAVGELAAGEIRTGFMIDTEWSLDETPEKLAAREEKGRLKILIRP
jgi:threonine dehydrogenase-like Zn-dependent dehydrogenase